MRYDKETTDRLIARYKELSASFPQKLVVETLVGEFSVPDRSIIAKLSSLGLYKRAEYLDKRGNVPVKKEEYIERIAAAMNVNIEILESLEKCNKNVLALIEKALKSE